MGFFFRTNSICRLAHISYACEKLQFYIKTNTQFQNNEKRKTVICSKVLETSYRTVLQHMQHLSAGPSTAVKDGWSIFLFYHCTSWIQVPPSCVADAIWSQCHCQLSILMFPPILEHLYVHPGVLFTSELGSCHLWAWGGGAYGRNSHSLTCTCTNMNAGYKNKEQLRSQDTHTEGMWLLLCLRRHFSTLSSHRKQLLAFHFIL